MSDNLLTQFLEGLERSNVSPALLSEVRVYISSHQGISEVEILQEIAARSSDPQVTQIARTVFPSLPIEPLPYFRATSTLPVSSASTSIEPPRASTSAPAALPAPSRSSGSYAAIPAPAPAPAPADHVRPHLHDRIFLLKAKLCLLTASRVAEAVGRTRANRRTGDRAPEIHSPLGSTTHTSGSHTRDVVAHDQRDVLEICNELLSLHRQLRQRDPIDDQFIGVVARYTPYLDNAHPLQARLLLTMSDRPGTDYDHKYLLTGQVCRLLLIGLGGWEIQRIGFLNLPDLWHLHQGADWDAVAGLLFP